MRRHAGQAARAVLWLLHHLGHLAMALAVIGSLLLAGAAWRLAQGPVNLSWFTARLEAAVNTPDSPVRLRIGSTALAWEGFRLGVDHPLDLRLTDVSLAGPGGEQRLAIPSAEVSLSIGALLLGRIQPRAVELDQAKLLLYRSRDGTLSLQLGEAAQPERAGSPLLGILAALARPPSSDATMRAGWLSQLRRLRIRDAAITIEDAQLGGTWQAPHAELDLRRAPEGGVTGSGSATLAVADQQAQISLTASLSAEARATRLTAQLSPITPAALARAVPALAPLAVLDAPVGGQAAIQLGPTLDLEQARASLHIAAGSAKLGDSQVPIVSGTIIAEATPVVLTLDAVQLGLRGRPDGPVTTLSASGTVQRAEGRIAAQLRLALDAVEFADLQHLWPEGMGGGARSWVTENITEGTARDAHIDLAVSAAEDLTDIALTSASGTLDGDGLTVHWLRPVPPIDNGRAQLRILDADTLEIAVLGGRERLRNSGSLTIQGGSFRITGLMHKTQLGSVQAQIAGSVPNALALLREPRLRLLATHPIALNNPAGQFSGTLSVTLPLEARLEMDDVAIHASARLDGVHLDGVAAGRPLDQGKLEMTASSDGLTLSGSALLAGIASKLDASMDFRAGPATQVVQHVSVAARPDAKQLAAAGLDASEILSGPVPIQAEFKQRRSGQSSLSVQADLTPATLTFDSLDWRKPPGLAAHGSIDIRLLQDRLQAIDRFAVQGDGLSVQGSATAADGKIAVVNLDKAMLGRSSLHGTVRLPARQGQPIAVTVSGPALDLGPRLTRARRPEPAPQAEPPPGPPWTLSAQFDRVLMASNFLVTPLTVEAVNDGRVFQRLHVAGETGPNGPFELRITPENGNRRLTMTAAQGGDLLRALDWVRTMQGGKLAISGTYNDALQGHPVSGTAELTDFRVREAAGLGKLLQAMTLYGLVDALRGPGLSFNRAIVPFRFTAGVLELTDARAFSASLGLTAKGRLDTDANLVDVEGTIVPAYFFNSLLGHIPVLGKLLSPEQGGGVFAARYTLRGKLDDPDVSVNPLSALTPGFLRGLFGLL